MFISLRVSHGYLSVSAPSRLDGDGDARTERDG